MTKLRTNWTISILFLLYQPLLQADFLGDRCYVNYKVPLEPGIVRLFVGKESTNRCWGNTIEKCITWLGEPDEVEVITSNETKYTFFGTKQLYRGTGSENVPVGLEWREMTVVDGQVVTEYSTIQIMERGYSWLPSKPAVSFDADNYSCESYGECNSLRCSKRLTSIEPAPLVQDTSPILENYSVQELVLIYRQLVIMDVCSVITDEYFQHRSKILGDWSMTKPGLAEVLEYSPEYLVDVEMMKENLLASERNKQQGIEFYCNNYLPKTSIDPTLE